MPSNTVQNKFLTSDSSPLGHSYPLSLHQPESHLLKSHQQRPSTRHLQPKPYPPILPNTAAGTHPFHSQPFEPAIENDREVKSLRSIRACDICRRKKIKCIGNGAGNVCKNCGTNNIECTYNESAKKRGPPKGYKDDLNNRLKRLETLLGGMDDDQHMTEATNGNISTTKSTTTASTSPRSPVSRISLTRSLLTTSNLAAKSTSPNSDGTNTSNPEKYHDHQQHVRKPHAMIIESHPRYVDDVGTLQFLSKKFNLEDERLTSSIAVKIRRLGKNLVIFDEVGNVTNGQTPNQLLLEDLGILKPGEPVLGMDDWIWKVAGITKTSSDQLMKIYFTFIHPGLPVVNKTLFLDQYRGHASDYPPAPLLNAMYGAATRYAEKYQTLDDGDSLLDTFDKNLGRWELPQGGSERFYGRLMTYIKGIYAPSMTTVQAMVIAQNHRANTENGMTCDWLIIAAAVRMAQDLGLQRSSETLDISECEKETRCRVWWAVYIMDKWAAASLGRPQTIFDEDCDQGYPSESAPWEEVMDVAMADDQELRFPSLDPSIAKKAKGEKIPLYQPFVQLAKLSEILGRILQDLYTPQAKKHSAMYGSDVIVAELDKALSDWRAALPPTLQLSGTNLQKLDSSGKTPLLSISVLLYLSYCSILILLHRPFIVKHGKPTTKSSESSLSICISAATRCVDVASSLQFRDFVLLSWNFALYHVFTASMIHGHTALNSDSVVSDAAKAQLIKALRVVKYLSKFSTKASEIYDGLLEVTRSFDIPMDNPLSNDDTQDITYHQISDNSTQGYSTESSTPHNSIETTDDNIVDPANVTEMVTGKQSNSFSVNSQSVPHHTQQHDDKPKNICSTPPTSTANDDWINGLYSSFQHDDSQAPSINTDPSLKSDPNSLQQFGLNIEQMFTPIDQPCNTGPVSNTLPINQSHQLNYAAAGLPQNFLFGLASAGLMEQQTQQQNTTGANLFPDTTSSVPQHNNQYGDSTLSASDDLAPVIDNSFFRNRPDNPFWSVPSSMEMDDLVAFLLHPR